VVDLAASDGVILMIDSSSAVNVDEAFAQLEVMITDPVTLGIPLLVLANKQDMENSLNVATVAARMQLVMQTHRPWKIVGCSLVPRVSGVDEGIYWLLNTLVMKKPSK
jgi:signal recognition particle receptor subunit beta